MRLSVAVAAVCLSIVGLVLADDVRAAIRKPTNIPAEGLGPALKQLAHERKLQVVFQSEIVDTIQTRGAVGELTTQEALYQLLEGTNLVYRFLDDKTITILPASDAERSGAGPAQPSSAPPPISSSQKPAVNSGAFLLAQATSGQAATQDQTVISRVGQKEDEQTGAAKSSQDTSALQEVTVTGSRIARTTDDLPAPATIIGAPEIAQTGLTSIDELLNRVPQFGMSVGNSQQYFPDQGATLINLRGLGTNRTLVLVDGLRRVSGTASSSAVDLSTIPTNLIDRVEVITGGASAVYGADAVTGVVNVILKHHADGLELSAKGGTNTYGDNDKAELGVLYGRPLGDGGEFTFAVSYTHESPLRASAVPWGRNPGWDFANPDVTAANPYINLPYSGWRLPNNSYGGAFVINGVRYTIGSNGVLRPTENGSLPYGPLSYLGAGGGDGYNNTDWQYLRPRSDVLAGLIHAAERIAGSLTLTTDFQYSRATTDTPLEPLYDGGLVIQRTNPFVPAAVGALMDQYGLTQLLVSRNDFDQGVVHRLGDRSTYTLVEKLSGTLGQFTWDTFYQYGRYNNESTVTNERIVSRFLQALDVIEGPSGPQCADPSAVAAGCQPLNIFGPQAATPAALAYFHDNPVEVIENSQQVMGAQMEGPLLPLPGGQLALSLGAEYRRETQAIQQDGLAAEGALFESYGPSSSAGFSVKEAYAELLAPILKDVLFAKTLELDGAVRESDYDTVGSTTTWRLGAQWAPTSDVRFRITRASSVRAPNLSELFSPGQGSPSNYYDPCSAIYIHQGSQYRVANCAALGVPTGYIDPLAPDTRLDYTVGNPNLVPEKSRSWTAGMVVTPSAVPNLRLEADWWSVDIAGAINSLPDQQVINGCVDATTLNNSFCPYVQRSGTFQGRPVGVAITQVNLAPLNIGVLKAEGVDFDVGYGLDLHSLLLNERNQLSWSLGGSYYIKNNSVVDANNPSNVIRLAGETVLPKLRMNLTTQFSAGPLSFDWIVRYISRSVVDENDPANFLEDNQVGSVVYHDLYVSYDLGKRVVISGGINNVANRTPPTNDSIGVILNEIAQPYDYVGRYFFLQLKAKF